MKNFEGELFGLKVKSSPYVDEDSVYLINPKNINAITKMNNFKPYGKWHKVKRYFENLFKALAGKL